MQQSSEKATKFWDRVPSIVRISSKGEELQKGSLGGLNVVRIQEGRGGRCFITAYCLMQQLCNANILQWPSEVSEDGLTINIWLFDFSLGRNGSKRLFKITFFDEVAASKFFSTYTESLPGRTKEGLSYWEMRDRNTESEGEEDEGLVETQQGEEKDKNHDLEDDAGDEQENGGGSNADGDVTATSDDMDDLKRILEMEDNYGFSQPLFDPKDPSDYQ